MVECTPINYSFAHGLPSLSAYFDHGPPHTHPVAGNLPIKTMVAIGSCKQTHMPLVYKVAQTFGL